MNLQPLRRGVAQRENSESGPSLQAPDEPHFCCLEPRINSSLLPDSQRCFEEEPSHISSVLGAEGIKKDSITKTPSPLLPTSGSQAVL